MSNTNSISRARDIKGMKFGRLTVLDRDPNPNERRLWLCVCECGTTLSRKTEALTSGNTKSCGCLGRDKLVANVRKHGMSGKPEYVAWAEMWKRCTNPKAAGHSYYVDRCPPESWRSFETFYSDMGPKPNPKHSLDRIDNALPYGPGNCRWATQPEQARNKSTTLWVCYQGEVLSFVDACIKAGLDVKYTRSRWDKYHDMLRASKNTFDRVNHRRNHMK